MATGHTKIASEGLTKAHDIGVAILFEDVRTFRYFTTLQPFFAVEVQQSLCAGLQACGNSQFSVQKRPKPSKTARVMLINSQTALHLHHILHFDSGAPMSTASNRYYLLVEIGQLSSLTKTPLYSEKSNKK